IQRQARGQAGLPHDHGVPRPALKLVALDLDRCLVAKFLPRCLPEEKRRSVVEAADLRWCHTRHVEQTWPRLAANMLGHVLEDCAPRSSVTVRPTPISSRCG